jgi:hypothetical protein
VVDKDVTFRDWLCGHDADRLDLIHSAHIAAERPARL